jgi:CubicO group peptidase (beta-lactamase class C family)
MKKLFFFSCYFLAAMMLNAQSVDPRLEGIEKTIEQLLKEWNVPGASIAIVEKNKVLMTKGFGYKDYERKLPATENTLFAIGSCSKAFTAALLSEPISKNTLDLDKPIQCYYPSLQFKTSELNNSVTLRDMLTHRTGLPRHDFAWYSGAATTREGIVQQLKFLEPSSALRQNFQYNNYMYIAIGAFLEKQMGKTWEQQVQEKIFTPLGMVNSTTGNLANQKDFANGYKYTNNQIQSLPFLPDYLSGVAPAGGICSNAKDMSNWLLMWTNQGKFDGKDIISNLFYTEAISSQMIVQPNLPTKYTPDYYFFNYGLGWYTANYRGHYGVGHGGNINGFSSFVTFLPTDSIGIFISLNLNNSPLVRVLNNILIDRMIAAPFRDWNMMIKSTINKSVTEPAVLSADAKPTHKLSSYSGTYTNEGYGTISIKENNGLLEGTFNKWQLNVKHKSYNYFTITLGEKTAVEDGVALDAEFLIDEKGKISAIKVPFESAVSDIVFNKQAQINKPGIDMKKYVGEYTVLGMTAKIYLSETGILKAVIPGQPEYEMEYIKEEEFAIKGAKGVKVLFAKDKKDAISGFTLVQPNGKFTATKK